MISQGLGRKTQRVRKPSWRGSKPRSDPYPYTGFLTIQYIHVKIGHVGFFVFLQTNRKNNAGKKYNLLCGGKVTIKRRKQHSSYIEQAGVWVFVNNGRLLLSFCCIPVLWINLPCDTADTLLRMSCWQRCFLQERRWKVSMWWYFGTGDGKSVPCTSVS